MQRPSQRQTPSSPIDRFPSRFQRDDTRSSSDDNDDRQERRTAHFWGQKDYGEKESSLSPLSVNRTSADCSFEDFRPADPVSRLDSSAQSTRTSVATAGTLEAGTSDAHAPGFMTPPENLVPTPKEVMDSLGNRYPEFDREICIATVDWATPAASIAKSDLTGPQRHGSHFQFERGSQPDSYPKRPVEETSQELVESYHATLQKLNKANNSENSRVMSSVAQWLRGQERNKPDLRLAEHEREQMPEMPSTAASPVIYTHNSTFQPADQHKPLITRSRSQERQSRKDNTACPPSIAPEFPPRDSPRKEHKHSFFGSFGSAHKHQTKKSGSQERRASTLSQLRREEDPFGQLSPLTFELGKSSGRGRTGYFSRTARSSEGDDTAPVKGPYVGFSRRTEEFEEHMEGGGRLEQLKPSPPEQNGWLRPRRPRLMRYSSSSISPGDTSTRAMDNPAAYDQWKAVLDREGTPPRHLNNIPDPSSKRPLRSNTASPQLSTVPPHFSKPVQPSPTISRPVPGYFSTEALRVRTSLISRQRRGNKATGYFWDSWIPHGADTDDDKKGDVNRIYLGQFFTPFPQPNDASTTSAVSDTGEKDWYRIRIDQGVDEEEPKDLDELRMFEWDLPEHLPGSPLCPLSPKHPGKGKGVCVYHGRKRRGGVGKGLTSATTAADLGVDLWK